MISKVGLNKKRICRYALFIVLLSTTINCILWDLGGEPISHDVFAGTYTAISREQTEIQREVESQNARDTEWADYNNAESTRRAAEYQTILAAPTTSPPVILRVEFPSEIPGDGNTVNGKLFFQDPDGDVNRLTIDVISATDFGSADYDPRPYLISGDARDGVYQLYIWCKGQQDVVLQARLQDDAGYWSNPRSFKFTCQ